MELYTQETKISVGPARVFKALIYHSDTLYPMLAPEFIDNVELLQGRQGIIGSVRQVNFAPGLPFKNMKERLDEVDDDRLYVNYTTFEGDMFADKIKLIVNEGKVIPTEDGGSLCSHTAHYRGKEGVELDEKKINKSEELLSGIFKRLEDYLLANPHLYV